MFSFLFGTGKNKIRTALSKGAVIIDVRTVNEYDQGRIRGSINIPMDRLASSIGRIRSFDKPLLICGGADNRSGEATRFLQRNDLKEVINAGSWEKLLKIINAS